MTTSKYSKRTVWIHWFSALLIFLLISSGINMEHMEHSLDKWGLYKIHFVLGILVFFLTILRVIALFKDVRPTSLYPNSFHGKFINFVHKGFYIVISWMCLSGIISLFVEGIYPALLANEFALLPQISADGFHPVMMSHHIVAKFVFLLLIFHISGFVVHLIRKRENSIKRIW